MVKKYAIFGAGKIGKYVADILLYQQQEVEYFIDNYKKEKVCMGIPVIRLNEYKKCAEKEEVSLIIACGKNNKTEIEKQLSENGITDYRYYGELDMTDDRERVISYASEDDLEDVILYNVLKGEKEIFYIDVGCNDPFELSVTKLLRDTRKGWGINIDPQRKLIEYMDNESKRDINLCIGCGSEEKTAELYLQGMFSTVIADNAITENIIRETIKIVPLKYICEKYLKERTEFSFLKIDVEGSEKEVLMGMDFSKWRPWIVVMESTLPGTMISSYEEWENILLDNGYHLAFIGKIERYYVANEKKNLDKSFLGIDELKKKYKIYHAQLSRLF